MTSKCTWTLQEKDGWFYWITSCSGIEKNNFPKKKHYPEIVNYLLLNNFLAPKICHACKRVVNYSEGASKDDNMDA